MSRAQEQIDCLGAMSAALLLGDTACTLSDDKITFACDADRFAKIVTQAMLGCRLIKPQPQTDSSEFCESQIG